jgi:hypothetical protein
MPQIRSYHANFTAGELSDDLLARTDLRAYQNGARKLRNVFIKPTGAVVRRSGLRFVDLAKGPGRLAEFEFNNEQVYLLVFTDHVIDIYHDGERIVTLWAPWSLSQLGQLNWTQSADTLLIVHPEVPPQRLTRLADGRWDLADWGIKSEGGRMQWPHYKFAGEAVTCQPTQTTGNINIYCSQPSVFTDRHLGARIRLNNRELIVTALIPGWGISAFMARRSG